MHALLSNTHLNLAAVACAPADNYALTNLVSYHSHTGTMQALAAAEQPNPVGAAHRKQGPPTCYAATVTARAHTQWELSS